MEIIRRNTITAIVIGSLLIIIAAALLLPQQSNAQAANQVQTGIDITAENAGIEQTPGTPENISQRIGTIVNYAFAVVSAIFLTVVLIGGYEWMIAGGNEEKIAKAKKWVINGINGIIIIFLAYALVYVILFALGRAIGLSNGT